MRYSSRTKSRGGSLESTGALISRSVRISKNTCSATLRHKTSLVRKWYVIKGCCKPVRLAIFRMLAPSYPFSANSERAAFRMVRRVSIARCCSRRGEPFFLTVFDLVGGFSGLASAFDLAVPVMNLRLSFGLLLGLRRHAVESRPSAFQMVYVCRAWVGSNAMVSGCHRFGKPEASQSMGSR